MPLTLIEQKPSFTKTLDERIDKKGDEYLEVSEMFLSIQGEGISTGIPSIFLRLQGCTLLCVFKGGTICDTTDVWKVGNPYLHDEIFDLFEKYGVIQKLSEGIHLVITGGSPLKQQTRVIKFLERFKERFGFLPFIEIENECVLPIYDDLRVLVSQWNNSPKLSNAGMKERVRYKPEIIKQTALIPNSWFKFVITDEEDWNEIQEYYLDTNLIRRDQVILMPEGDTQDILNERREIVADLAIKNNVRFSDRLHVTMWNKKTGV